MKIGAVILGLVTMVLGFAGLFASFSFILSGQFWPAIPQFLGSAVLSYIGINLFVRRRP